MISKEIRSVIHENMSHTPAPKSADAKPNSVTLTVWHRGINPTLGSKFLSLLGPLHFGTQWGLTVKVIWFLLGISLAVLSTTGPIMYWNRVLAKKWKLLRQMVATGK